MKKEAKSIERIAEELGVNFFDLHPLLKARDEWHFKAGYDKAMAQLAGMTAECKQMGRKEVLEWLIEISDDSRRMSW